MPHPGTSKYPFVFTWWMEELLHSRIGDLMLGIWCSLFPNPIITEFYYMTALTGPIASGVCGTFFFSLGSRFREAIGFPITINSCVDRDPDEYYFLILYACSGDQLYFIR